ncbi:MAG: 2-oxoglutarate dehydrogenase, E2 component, dihydrolipoamide succinyltransferase [Acidobacteriales bacterium]|nr:2-oxoglutarate dehydrogenase, E2 component, dihydrolipoamide succinyltransferase [Terriglobales bacterium]
MPTDVIMPQMGESIFEGTLTKWLKKPGDRVQRDEPLFEISTDKVDAEIPAPASGVLKEVKVSEGTTVQVNTVVGVIDAEGAAASAAPPAKAPEAAKTAGSTRGGTASTEGPATTKPGDGGAKREAAPPAQPKPAAPAPASGGPGTDVIMPQMGESIFEGTLTKWLKQPGEKVQRDEPLFEISTDKVDAEIPAPVSGVLREQKVAAGTTVQVNTVVGVIAPEGAAAPSAAAPAPARASGNGRQGEKARAGGAVAAQRAGEEETEIPTTLRGRADVEPAARPAEQRAVAKQAETVIQFPAADRDQEGRRIRSSPLVRRIAREQNISLGNVPGSGLGGRITKQDILGFVERYGKGGAPAAGVRPGAAQAQPARAAAAPAPVPMPSPVPGELVPMSAMRKKIAERMVQSKHTSAHVHSVFKVDMTRVVRIREREKAGFEQRHGVKLTYMPFIARAVIAGIKQMPIINASVEGENIRYHRNVNIGIAVALDWGLIVPVVKQAEERSFVGLQRAINDLGERARSKKLVPDEVQGGTFTITNPGIFGPQFGTPIIMQPQVAILGMGGIFKEPVVITDKEGNDSIQIRSIIRLSLGYDHRIVDGADADRFLVAVKNSLENWNEEIG